MFAQVYSVLHSLFFNGLVTVAFAQDSATPAAPAAAPVAPPPAWMQFVPFVVIIGVFYLFLLRPQAKKQREQQNFFTNLKSGDQVITNSGILGKITGIAEKVVTLEIANGVQIKVLRNQISAMQSVLQNQPTK